MHGHIIFIIPQPKAERYRFGVVYPSFFLYSAITTGTWPCSAVGNVSDYKCAPDFRSRGREFGPGPVPYFVEIDHEIISTVFLLPSADSFKRGCC